MTDNVIALAEHLPEVDADLIESLRTMLERGKFTSQEIRTLRGVISSIDRRHERPNPNRMKKTEGEG